MIASRANRRSDFNEACRGDRNCNVDDEQWFVAAVRSFRDSSSLSYFLPLDKNYSMKNRRGIVSRVWRQRERKKRE